MISLIIFVLFTVFTAAMLISTREHMTKEDPKYPGRGYTILNISWLIKPGLIFISGIIISLVQPFALERVEQGYKGIKVNLTGSDRGLDDYEYKTGWVVYNTWTTQILEYPMFQQHIEFPEQNVITKGGFSATIKPTFNYVLKEESIGEMFLSLRLPIEGIEKGWLNTAIVGSVNDVANKWEVDAIFNNREKFESAIIDECNKRVSQWFIISQLRTNIIPPDALKSAIEAKTKAVQEAQAKMQEALVADANAKKMIAIAKGDSAKAVITASGQAQAAIIEAKGTAEAMRLKKSEISELYVEFIKAQRWDGVLPVTTLGNATPMISIK
jgi:regulator of protease activity HflC (stomatin/prohibitin superfamily)